MMSIAAPWRRVLSAACALGLSSFLWLGAAGCAGQGGMNAAAQKDVATSSDESDQRRRARIRLELAVGYFDQGQTNVALDELKQSIAIDPNFVDSYNLRGLIYLRLNDLPLADESFRRALQLSPRDGDTLHNYAWLLCQQGRYAESNQFFNQAIAAPNYLNVPKSYMAQGMCQARAGNKAEAERLLLHAYELNPGIPMAGFQLAQLFYDKGEYARAQFYIRRINNDDFASAESLWLGMRVEKRLQNGQSVAQLGTQLKRRFPGSREASLYDRGAFDE